VHPSSDLSGYRLVVVPTLYLCSDETAAALTAYVEAGGHVLVTYFSGIVDPDDHVRLGGYPGAFRDLLGVRVEEFAPLLGGESVALDDGSRADLWTELVTVRDAEVVARFASGTAGGPRPGGPALTRRTVGSGVAWYLATRLDEPATAALADRIAGAAGVARLPAGGVEAVRRGRYLFVLNPTGNPVTVTTDGVDLLAEDRPAGGPGGTVTIAGGGAAVIREGDH
jgi:beta-galactosidase